jgi:leader peptidase (prepilin peptidase)/N-methyltransferase
VEIFELWPLALLIVAGLVGLVVGSFLNVVAYRLPIMMELAWRADAAEAHSIQVPPHAAAERFNLAWPPSTCLGERTRPSTASRLELRVLRGCGVCAAAFRPRYPLVEAATAVLGIAVAYTLGPGIPLAALGFT